MSGHGHPAGPSGQRFNLARRQQAYCYSASTIVEFEPRHFQQMAGLICYYNAAKFHYLHISNDNVMGKHLRVMSALPDQHIRTRSSPPIRYPPPSRRTAGRGRL